MKVRIPSCNFAFFELSVSLCSVAAAETVQPTASLAGYEFTPNVVYGQGVVTQDGETVSRDLWMDVYTSSWKAKTPRPAVTMAFGGSFHRGGPSHNCYVDGAKATSMEEY